MDYSVEKGTPGSVGSGPGARTQGTEGSQYHEVVFIIFLTMKEMSIHGDPRMRPWLERRMRTLKKGPGTVVEFHQETLPRGET